MNVRASAGDFEIRFADGLAGRLAAGEQLSLELVRECYGSAGDALGLPVSGADELHVMDVFDALSRQKHLSGLRKERLSKIIFDIVYMH